jgi:hypothetical protein
MLPAKKQEARPETPQNSPASSTMGFGKVLTSIQGLQQRLEDFSVEDVVRTEADAKSLVLELSQLQIKLETLAGLKQFVASANHLISEIPEENFEQIAPDGFENHPQLHAIIQASKLIRLHRIMQAAKAGAESISLDLDTGTLSSVISPPERKQPEFDATMSPPSEPDVEKPSVALFETAAEPIGAAVTSVSEPRENVQSEEWTFSTEDKLDGVQEVVTARLGDFELGHSTGGEVLVTQDPSVIRTSIEMRDDQSKETIPASKSAGAFDERFLSDLIETYGEFRISSVGAPPVELPSKPEPSLPSVIESETQLEPVDSSAASNPPSTEIAVIYPEQHTPSLPAVEPHTLPALMSTPSREEETKAFELPAIATPEKQKPRAGADAKEKKLSALSKHGELDRQLKSIIKDYGEYDLYPPQSSINFKMAALGAFAVLALVLGGFYFFRVPAAPTPVKVGTVGQPDGADRTTHTDTSGPKTQSK